MREQLQRFIKEVVDEGLFEDDEPLVQLELDFDSVKEPLLKIFRPQTRGDCVSIPRPCPFVGCRYNLYLDVRPDGGIRFNFPDREPDEMTASCALDLAADGPRILDLIGGLMGMSKERARQLEASGLRKVKAQFDPDDPN